jgi:hypothetical protein
MKKQRSKALLRRTVIQSIEKLRRDYSHSFSFSFIIENIEELGSYFEIPFRIIAKSEFSDLVSFELRFVASIEDDGSYSLDVIQSLNEERFEVESILSEFWYYAMFEVINNNWP